MAGVASTRQDLRLAQTRVGFGLSPILVLTMVGLAISIIYLIGLENKPMIHNAFHDLRHGTGFPCH